jgi:mRNA interferase MazF
VIAAGELAARRGLLWVLMITSADNRGWEGDVAIDDHRGGGLPAPSLVRTAKIATIEAGDAQKLGVLPPKLLACVRDLVAASLALPGRP